MSDNKCIVRVKLNNHTTFMSDEVSSILYDHNKGKDMVTLCLTGQSVSFNLDDIEILQLYPKSPTVDK